MATYKEIQEYVKNKYECSVKSCWIAESKELSGLSVKPAHNRISKTKRKNSCPEEKTQYIIESFKHFGMIK
jgi:predicted RNA-binding protein with RPS1 domain